MLAAPLIAAAVNFLFLGAQAQHQVLLFRDLRSSQIASTDAASALLSALAAIALGLAGAGVWALIGQQLVNNLILLGTRWACTHWTPQAWSRQAGLRPIFRSGLHYSGASLLTFLSRNVDNFAISYRLGVGQLGIYSRAFQLASLPANQILTPLPKVLIPYLNRVRSDKDAYSNVVMRAQLTTGYFGVCFVAITINYSDTIIAIALGPGWEDVVPIFQILIAAIPFQFATAVMEWFFLAEDKSRTFLQYSSVAKIVTIIGVLVGVQHGVVGAALGYAMGSVLAWPLCLVWLGITSDIPMWRFFRSGSVILLTAAASSTAVWAVRDHPIALSTLVALWTTTLCFLCLAASRESALMLYRHFRRATRD